MSDTASARTHSEDPTAVETDASGTVERARGGDRQAFQQLVEQHRQDVFRLACRITGNESDAEDAVQETFLRAYRKLPDFEARAEFGTWLYRIATNCSLDLVRQRQRQAARQTSLDDGSNSNARASVEPAAVTPAADRLLFSRQLQDRLQTSLDALSPMERQAFELRHLEGRPLVEIGERLGTRTSATKQAVFRAVRKLRRDLMPLVVTAGVALVLGLLVVAYFAGRASAPRVAETAATDNIDTATPGTLTPDTARRRVLQAAVAPHLRQSRQWLTELSNTQLQDVQAGDFRAGELRQRAAELLDANRLFRRGAETSGDPLLAEYLQRLERLLLELANTAPDSSPGISTGPGTGGSSLDDLRQRAERQDLIFRGRVLERRLSQRSL